MANDDWFSAGMECAKQNDIDGLLEVIDNYEKTLSKRQRNNKECSCYCPMCGKKLKIKLVR